MKFVPGVNVGSLVQQEPNDFFPARIIGAGCSRQNGYGIGLEVRVSAVVVHEQLHNLLVAEAGGRGECPDGFNPGSLQVLLQCLDIFLRNGSNNRRIKFCEIEKKNI